MELKSTEPQAKRMKLSAEGPGAEEVEKQCDQCMTLEKGGDEQLKEGTCSSCGQSLDDETEIKTTVAAAAVHLREEDTGITEYISPHPGFFAILKQRYSDFIVHELTLDGSVVKLTDLSLPQEPSGDPQGTKVSLEKVCSADDVDKLLRLSKSSDKTHHVELKRSATKTLSGTETISAQIVAPGGVIATLFGMVNDKASDDKDQRTLVHRAIREHFPALESRTVDGVEEAERIIRVTYSMGKKGSRQSWPRDRGSYCRFVLYKENRDTMEAISLLAKMLKMKPSCFQYAGTKDRRAITSQNITAFKVLAKRLQGLNSSCRNMQLGNFQYVSDPLKLGSLSGNQFTIVLRDVGFVNYFGMQRFGTSTVPTYDIGRCLLRSDWQGAIDLILKPRPGETEELSSARQYYWETRDLAGTLARFPKRRSIEIQLLLGLQKLGPKNDLLGALNFIPRNARLMYVHSYQSLLWNKMASWRIQECGMEPVGGDLVQTATDNGSGTCGNRGRKDSVEYVTEENITRYSVHDVVLPLPGYDVLFPRNKVGEQYHRLLKEDGFSVEQLQHRVKDFALPGSYRTLVTKPSDVMWEVLHYDDVTIPLTLSDVDSLENKPKPQSVPGGKLKALKLRFSLPSATYATMAVRELLKRETSSYHQAQLNPMCDSCLDT